MTAQAILAKKCTRCGESKQPAEFGIDKRAKDLLRSSCKACARLGYATYTSANADKVKADKAAWRAANADKVRALSAAWYAENSERAKANAAAYKSANPDKVKACNSAWRKANPEKVKAYSATWSAANREKERAKSAAWAKANKNRMKATAAAWKKANPDAARIRRKNRRARILGSGGALSKGLSAKLFKLQKGLCPCCAQPLGDDYHLDHIMPVALGGSNTDGNIQLLRATCNLQKNAKHPVDFMRQRGFLI